MSTAIAFSSYGGPESAYALRDASQAHREVETGHVRGKVVLTGVLT